MYCSPSKTIANGSFSRQTMFINISQFFTSCCNFEVQINNFKCLLKKSSNLTKEDWNQIHQNVWFQDFPKTKTPTTSAFGTELMNFIAQLKLNPKFLMQYDFSIAKASLVCSVPGYHTGADFNKYGHLKLASLVEKTAAKSLLKEKIVKDEICFQVEKIMYNKNLFKGVFNGKS